MDFNKLLSKKDKEEEYYWSLLIEPGWIQAGIWKIEGKKAQVVITSPTSAWGADEDLVTSSDTALSSAIQGFPEDLNEPSKTVFGVSSSWVKKGQISEEHLEKIKKLCDELSLTPIGFVILPEALAHYKKSIEGASLNAVTLGIYKEKLEISVFSKGNLVGSSLVSRSVSLEDDVAEGLARFAGLESVPSRFLLYDGKEGELEEARQSLLNVNWESFGEVKILHTPKIEIVNIKTKVHAVSLAGASELAGVTSLEVIETLVEKSEKDSDKKQTSVPKSTEETSSESSIPIEKLDLEKKERWEKEVFDDEDDKGEVEKTLEDLGFAVGRDISSEAPKSSEEELSQEIERYHENVRPAPKGVAGPKISPLAKLKKGFAKMKDAILKFKPSLKFPKIPGVSFGKRIFLLGFLFLGLIAGLGFAAWWFLPKATVTIYLSPQKLGEDAQVFVDTSADSPDFENGTLVGEMKEVAVSGEKTKDATGTKTVGDKAQGEVTLYRVGPKINLDAGTALKGPEGLSFVLDNSISVASGSASSPGTTKVKVTAQDIGAQYNLAGDTSFSVDNYSSSDIEAKNEDSFSGGSSREISAVSAGDLEVLEEDLLEELSDRAKSELSEELPSGKFFIEESVDVSVSSKEFSADEGEEASTLKLSMEVEAKAVLVEKSVLNEYTLYYLNEKVPQRYALREDQISYEFEYEGEDNGVYEFDLRISANLLPEIDKDEISKRLKGKQTSLAEEYLNKEVTGFVKAEIKIKPNLPEKIRTLPHVLGNIEVEFSAEK